MDKNFEFDFFSILSFDVLQSCLACYARLQSGVLYNVYLEVSMRPGCALWLVPTIAVL